MATTDVQSVNERVVDLNAEVQKCATAHEEAALHARSLRFVKVDDAAAFARAQLELPAAEMAKAETDEDLRLARVELQAAIEQARQTIQRERAPGRAKLVNALHRALVEARDARRDLLAYDATTETLLDGRSAGPSPAWGQLEALDEWRQAMQQ